MMPVLSRLQTREFDAQAMAACRVPGLVLMENAGRGATDVLVRELLGGEPSARLVVLVCGVGNNGGDGFVMARQLAVRGVRPTVLLAGQTERVSGDARAHREAWLGVGGQIIELHASGSLAALREATERADVVVDALFGTGLDRPIEGWLADVVATLNQGTCPRFAVDIPSGLDADTGSVLGVAVHAHMTATFAHHKLGLLTPNGRHLGGRVHLVDIGVPAAWVGGFESSAQLLEPADVARWFEARKPGAHKSSAGHVLVVAGSPGKLGAPRLSAHGSLRAGAGLATIATWPDCALAIEPQLLEVMVVRLDRADLAGSLDAALSGKHAVVVGPGLGLDDDARTAVEYLVTAWHGPVVIDADALTMFAPRPSVFSAARKAILTPHPGELGRLLGKTAAEVESDRFGAARGLVAATGAVVVLKGAHTVIAAPDGRLVISPVACPALATAGSGDTLSGIIAAAACAMPPFEAAWAGVMMHAMAGEAWSRAHHGADRGMLASEIADGLIAVRGALAEA